MKQCVFCHADGGTVLYREQLLRIVAVPDAYYPGYLRIITAKHVKELSDLSTAENLALYAAVSKCEKIIRRIFKPDKINLASLGNITPHVHWHIIPRFCADRHFPNPIWGEVTHAEYLPAAQLSAQQDDLLQNFSALWQEI